MDYLIGTCPYRTDRRLRTIALLEGLPRFRVYPPFAGLPVGLQG